MSQKLPVPIRNRSGNQTLAVPVQTGKTSSTLARLAISLAPDVLRAAERIVLKRDQAPAVNRHINGSHGHSVHLSEVEIDTSIPFVRRVTLRNASSWSTFPVAEPLPVAEGKRSKSRMIGLSGAVIVLAAVMARKVIPAGRIIDVQGRQRD